MCMTTNLRTFIDQLGGYRAVAARLGKSPTTLHGYMQCGKIPARFFDAMTRLADECGIAQPDRSLFSFDSLVGRDEAA